ncbi:ATP-dependent helicase HrpB [Kiloniella laminariae]|uniref:ATP-dependent helicase HrpB n=1 Tax=Kiloniella laminariae TaxID=454162 RepID=A0ABT4LLH4_9PROT|nr:ATP-dependent helicase HrpB [Kiloniella laminariae]MCZ4281924.1 ATP-dependent helicase HrpB [Kiloniella laminariae]
MTSLPIDPLLPEIIASLQQQPSLVLQAPPGAGKTTGVPLGLLDVDWLAGQKIIVLEPRRLAARSAAARMAEILGEKLGETVGYRIRHESRVGPQTRIEVVTEGVLTRLLQKDPELPGIGLVVFDEFHERSLQADLGLALCLEVQSALRDDLRLLVMSATLDGKKVSRIMGEVPILTSEGKSFPVQLVYGEETPRRSIAFAVADKIVEVLPQESGSFLVFLPGVGEISSVVEQLRQANLPADVDLFPLFGDLSLEDQRRAISPSMAGRRKIVLATAIAETSLTIDGVRVIIDCGYMRSPRFDPSSAMTRLETLRVSKASADQRAGRAGRIEPGVCYRLWPESQNGSLSQHSTPEILEADLCSLVLEVQNWGTSGPETLNWCDAPPRAAWQQATELLQKLGALDQESRITSQGREMALLPLHPRFAHMLLRARALGQGWLACLLAALLDERDIFKAGTSGTAADLVLRLEVLLGVDHGKGYHVDRSRLKRVRMSAGQYARLVRVKENSPVELGMAGAILSLAYPDRIAQLRPASSGRYKLSGGKGAELDELDRLATELYLTIAHLGGMGANAKIYLAAALSEGQIRDLHQENIVSERVVRWNEQQTQLQGELRDNLGALVLSAQRIKQLEPNVVVAELLGRITRQGLALLEPGDSFAQLCQRMACLRHFEGEDLWPDWGEPALLRELEQWLAPYLENITSLSQLVKLDLKQILLSQLSWQENQYLEREAPERYRVPSGQTHRINYENPEMPVLEVRLQEMFGLSETPAIMGKRVPLVLHLLSPARRPLQVTSDLTGFWQNSYHEVKKDMKGRYPRHYWPDDPLEAEPTTRIKKHMNKQE